MKVMRWIILVAAIHGSTHGMVAKCWAKLGYTNPELWEVLRSQDEKELRRLLENCVNPNNRDAEGSTPLIEACILNVKIKLLTILLEYGADPNVENKAGMSPLKRLVIHHNIEKVELLLKAGANPNIVEGDDFFSPLYEFALQNWPDCAELLLKYGATPLEIAKKGSPVPPVIMEYIQKTKKRS